VAPVVEVVAVVALEEKAVTVVKTCLAEPAVLA
jgi:hypothetical protein